MGPGMALDQQNIGTVTFRVAGMSHPVKLSDWRWDRLWSTLTFNNNDSTKRDWFIGTSGQQIVGGTRSLTDVDTNLPRSGDAGLPIDWEVFVFSIRTGISRVVGVPTSGIAPVDFDASSLNSDTANRRMLFEMNRKCSLEFRYNNKPRNTGRFEDFPSASGITMFSTDIGQEIANNGVPSPRDGYALTVPIHLRPNVSYRVSNTPVIQLSLSQAQTVNSQAATAVECYCKFEGLIKLPVA